MKVENIILHHSLTKDGQTVSWGPIRHYHTQELGWGDIGYHFGIELVGNGYEILLGRMPDEDGAHTKGMNSKALGICFVGNFDLAEPPYEQRKVGLKLIRWLLINYALPVACVKGHRDFATKSCPGTKFDLEEFRNDLKRSTRWVS